MAVQAVVSVVLQKINDMLKTQSLTQNKVIVYEVQEIIKSLNSMSRLMTQINQQPVEYLDAVYMVEDGIETFTLNVVRREKVFGFLTNHIFIFNNLNSCLKIHHKIKKITTQLMMKHVKQVPHEENPDKETAAGNQESLKDPPLTQATDSGSDMDELSFSYACDEEDMQIVGIKERFQHTKQMSSFSYKQEELGLFGLKKDVDTLVNQLLTNYSEHVVSIVGQGGIGKTTLARTIYKHRDIKIHFQFRAWVSMLEYYTTKDILLTLLKAMDNMIDKAFNMDDEKAVKLKLLEYLKNKKCLVILDGATTFNIWEDIKEIFPDVRTGSKLVLTSSRKMETTKFSVYLHYMMPLSEDDAWMMFKVKVRTEQNWDLVPEETKQAILQSCKGLPLNIVLLAGLFSMKEPSIWIQVFSFEQNSSSVLSIFYNDLSDNLKVCLLYLALFPKDFDIPVRRLLRLWLAEGFVKRNPTKEFLEDAAQMYFEELVNRNMIQISKLRSDSSPRRCRVLGLLHDYLLPKAHETNLFYTYHNMIKCEEVSFLNVRRMVEYESPRTGQGSNSEHVIEEENQIAAYPSLPRDLTSFPTGENITINQFETSNPSCPMNIQPKSSLFNPALLRSYMSFNHQMKDYRQAKQIGLFLGNIINDGFGLLRVLDLEKVYKPIFPENLGNLSNLRYLGLRSTYLDSLPPSVGELTHLETLDLKHTCIDELPGSVWRLKKLHHLNLNEICLNMAPHSSLRLLTLWGLFLDEKVPIKECLAKLNDLRELGITFVFTTNQEDLMNWIVSLRNLQSLRLRSKDNLGRPSKLKFKSMSNLDQLSRLNLLGNLEKLPDYNEFPPTLKVLTLSISLLKQDPMQTLGQIPSLTVLRLLGQSYIGKEIVCHKGGFIKLKVLKMWMLKELESWSVQEGSMQSLKHVDIRCCDKLHNFPTTLLQQGQLDKLVLTGMPLIFTAEVERLKSDHTSLTINHWKFPPLPWEQDDSTLVNNSII